MEHERNQRDMGVDEQVTPVRASEFRDGEPQDSMTSGSYAPAGRSPMGEPLQGQTAYQESGSSTGAGSVSGAGESSALTGTGRAGQLGGVWDAAEPQPWWRWGLIGTGVVVPLVALAVPRTRQAILGGRQSGPEQVQSGVGQAVKQAQSGMEKLVERVQSGSRQVAEQVTDQAEDVRKGWRRGQARRRVEGVVDQKAAGLRAAAQRRRQEQEAEERREQLVKVIKRREREVEKRDRSRGGLLSRTRPFIVGTLLGGGLGLLYAPQRGAQTRQQLRQQTGDLQQRASQVTQQLKEQVAPLQQQAHSALGQVKEQAQGMVNQVQERAQAPTGGQQRVAPATTLTMPATQQPGGATRVTPAQVRADMLVLGTNGEVLGTIDRIEGSAIKLKKDAFGQHHWIPLNWIARVDDQAHLSRSAQQARQEWQTTPPQGQ